ncbi:MAG: dihydrolipoyl dehydrogenase [Candidatus Omnitrophica bacterium]|nr:dihydrolipoyl dehydrogenase [Candidatus Omnitrophota bacterium]
MTYDIAILGAGPGGYVAALHAAKKGAKVAVVEEKKLGGVCLHTGCIPTKALITAAQQRNQPLDFASVISWKDQLVGQLEKGIQALFDKNKIERFHGRGKLVSPTRIEIKNSDQTSSSIDAKSIIIATGSRPRSLKGIPLDGERILSSDSLLALRKIPKELLILGGGVTGCEMAGLYQMLGSQVTLVEARERLLPGFDEEIAKRLAAIFTQKGIRIFLKNTFEEVKKSGKAVTAVLSNGEKISAEVLLVSVGREFQSQDIGVETVGIKTDKGAVSVDASLRTNIPTIYAIGDVTGRNLTAHAASHDGIVAVENILGNKMEVSRWVPQVVFTVPEAASVGASEEELKKKGLSYQVKKSYYASLGRAHILGEPQGWLKILAEEKSGKLLGVHGIGAHISELISEGTLALEMGANLDQLKRVIHPHPTLSEIWTEAVWS